MSQLEAIRFVQYDGEIQPYTGLHRPRLTVEVMLSSGRSRRVCSRIGDPTGDGHVFAAEGTSSSGPVFLLPAAAWDALIQSGREVQPTSGECLRAGTLINDGVVRTATWERLSCFRS